MIVKKEKRVFHGFRGITAMLQSVMRGRKVHKGRGDRCV